MDENGSKFVTQNEINNIIHKFFFFIYSFVVLEQYSLNLNYEHSILEWTLKSL